MAASVRLFFVAMLLMFWAVAAVYHRNSELSEVRADQTVYDRADFVQGAESSFDTDFQRASVPSSVGQHEFSLPFQGRPGAEYCLIVGCLNGDLLGNEFSLESQSEKKVAQTPEITPASFLSWAEYVAPPKSPKTVKETTGNRLSQPATQISVTPAQKQRSFFLYNGQHASGERVAYQEFQAICLAETQSVVVWCDEADQKKCSETVLGQQVGQILQTFERLIVPEVIPWLGEVEDIDRDDKFLVVLTSRLNQLQSNDSRLEGLTWGGDYHPTLSAPYSNRADLIYLNPTNPDPESLPAILIHEYVHAIAFSKRCRNSEPRSTRQIAYEEDWLNEAISHVVETEISGSFANIDHRLQEYNEWPERSPLVISDYYRAGLWRNAGCRGAVFSFVNWCVQQEGIDLIPKLIDSRQTGVENLESATGKSFERLFRDWGLAGVKKKSRRREVSAGEQYRWKQASTSVKYIHLTADEAGQVRYRIVARPGVRFQTSLVRLSDLKLASFSDFGELFE